ncbi:MAG: hypothetical protein NZL95_06915 [Chitinophagales bacterium]|nr:hypothetical protein [Chitinophagales bacterium]MDW8428268.1 hypothetical protein [Chitinophagales bacterium]
MRANFCFFALVLMHCAVLWVATPAKAQSLDEQAAAILMGNERLNAVILVLLIIFAALIVFLILQERKIKNLEKKILKSYE